MKKLLFIGLLLSSICLRSQTWKNVRIGGCGSVTSIKAHPKVPNLYFMTTDVGNPYRWNNTTQSWEALLNWVTLSNKNVGACANIAFDPNDVTGNILYATVGKYAKSWSTIGKVIKSTDRGTTWTDSNLSIWVGSNTDQESGERLAVDPQNSNVVYVTTTQNGTYKSTDAGGSWTQINVLNGEFVVFDVSAGLTGGVTKDIMIGTATGVQRSTDGGTSFANMLGSPVNVHRAAIHNNGTAYVTAETGLFKWNGSSWINISPVANTKCLGIDVNPNNSNEIITNNHWWGPYNMIFTSSNGGSAWVDMSSTMGHDFTEIPFQPDYFFSSSIFDFCWDPFTVGRVFFGDWYHVFQTDNVFASGGLVNWKARAKGHEEVVTTGVLVCPPNGVNALLSCTADVGGFDHTSLSNPPVRSMASLLPYINCTGVAFPENNTNFIARVGSINWNGVSSGGYSVDGGVNYTAFPSLPGSRGRIVMSADSETMLWATQGGGTFRSTDRGSSWTQITTIPTSIIGGGNIFIYSNPIASDKVNGNKFYVYNAGKVYVSTNGGVSFSVAASNLPNVADYAFIKIESTPGVEGDVWLSFEMGGLYHSTDSGTSFSQIMNVQSALLFSVGKALSNIPAIYVMGKVNDISDGVFKSDDNGINWTQIDNSSYRMGLEANSMAADRINYGRVFIGTNGNGIYVGETTSPIISVISVSMSPTSANINIGATQQFTTTISPTNAANQNVTWSSSNTTVATVNGSGLVTGISAGTATITATTQDGNKTATSMITISCACVNDIIFRKTN